MTLGHFKECGRCISASCEHYGRCRYNELMAFRAQADRSPEGQDGATRLDRNDESAVPKGCAQ